MLTSAQQKGTWDLASFPGSPLNRVTRLLGGDSRGMSGVSLTSAQQKGTWDLASLLVELENNFKNGERLRTYSASSLNRWDSEGLG